MNKYKGEVNLSINGFPCTLVYDWDAIATLVTEFGKEWYPELGERLGKDLEFTARVLAIGLARHHPEMTAEVIFSQSPPILPTIKAVMQGINLATLGKSELEEATKEGAGSVENPPKPSAARKIGSRRGGR